jgi:hypothetical protein
MADLMMRFLRLVSLIGLVGVFVLALSSLPPGDASIVHNPTPTPGSSAPTPVTPVSPGGSSRSGTSGTATVSDCHLYAGPGGFNKACFHPGMTSTGHVLTVGEILAGDALPVCWDVPLTAGELSDTRVQNTDTYFWLWQKCLSGIGPAPKYVIGPDGVKIETGLIALPVGSTPPGLTVNQQRLVGMYAAEAGDYPPVVAVPAPSGKARVNQLISFHGVPAVSAVLNVGGVVMQARVTHMSVRPLGSSSSDKTDCDGVGVATKIGDTPATTPKGSACWYTFHNSSAGQPNQAFPMAVTATWEVRYSTNPNADWATWTALATNIQVTTTTNQMVTEIQTLVVN